MNEGFSIQQKDAEHLLTVMDRAARAAATTLMQGYRTRPAVTKKGAIDLVTEFDHASEACLRRELAELNIPVVGEETGGDYAELTLCVDPLDGTTNYVHGHPFFCVTIGLLEQNMPVLGCVFAPALNLMWQGGRAKQFQLGASYNNRPCHVSGTSMLDDALLATGFPYDRRTNSKNNFREYIAIKKKVQGIRRCGSAAIDLCLVADGTYDGYWETKLNAWDYAGGAAIVLAAGGMLSGLSGEPANVRSGNLVASNGLVHNALIAELEAARVLPQL
jgi:myo-inositol-1(or 4)-monophosphatase